MPLELLVGSIVAVLLLVAVARALGLGGGAIGSAEAARQIVEEALPGFEAGDAFVSEDGDAALVIGAGGELALIKQHGTQPAVRRLTHRPTVERQADALLVASGDRLFGPVRLQLAPEARDKLLTLL